MRNFFKTGKFKLRLGALSVINGPSHLKSVPWLESKEALISKYSEDIYYKSTVDFLMYLVCVFKRSVINYISWWLPLSFMCSSRVISWSDNTSLHANCIYVISKLKKTKIIISPAKSSFFAKILLYHVLVKSLSQYKFYCII